MFDYVMFLKYASIVGMIGYGFLLFCSLLTFYIFEMTKNGQLEKAISELKSGKRIVGYSIPRRLFVFCLCLLVYISIQ